MDFSQMGSSGVQYGPQFSVIAGVPGVGKTTFALQFPKATVADLEDGSKGINVLKRFQPKDIPDFATMLKFLEWFRHGKHDFKSLTVDSLTKLEVYVHRHLVGPDGSIEKYEGGFGKGWTASREQGVILTEKFKDIVNGREADVNLIAHAQVKKHSDPYDQTEYDRYVLQGNEKFTQIIMSQADNVYFMKRVVFTEQDAKTKKNKAFFNGQRVIITEWAPGADAKNRLSLPAQIALPPDRTKAYETYIKAINGARHVTPAEIRSEIEALLPGVDPETREKATKKMAEAGDSIDDLKFIKEKVMEVAQGQS